MAWNGLKYEDDIHPRFNIPFILESVDFKYFLQLQGTAVSTVFAPTYATKAWGSHEIKLYDLIESNSNLDIRWYFVEKSKRFLDGCEILLKPCNLLTILNSVNNEIQFSIELSDNELSFLDILERKSGKKIWMNI